MNLQAILKPGDVLAVRGGGLAAGLIRVGEEMSGKPGLDNHVAIMHHWQGGVPWGLEGRPGGVGWADLRGYAASPYTVSNCAQPGRTGAVRAQLADDTLRAFRMDDLFSQTVDGVVPGHVVCSSFAAFLYKLYGWDHPGVPDRACEPADWTAFALDHGWNVKL